jgi:hypothetical protein
MMSQVLLAKQPLSFVPNVSGESENAQKERTWL